MKKLYFITGSQDLYGDETLKQVAIDSKEMAEFLNGKISRVEIEWTPTVTTSEEARFPTRRLPPRFPLPKRGRKARHS